MSFSFLQETVNLKGIPGKKKPTERKESIKPDDTDKDNEGRLFPKRKRPSLQKVPDKKDLPPRKDSKGKAEYFQDMAVSILIFTNCIE